MGALVAAAQLTERLGARLAQLLRKDAYSGTGQWYWPPSGNGDRGPPGTWQRNLNAVHDPSALVAFSAVYSCVNVISGDLAKLPPRIMQVMPTGEEKELLNDPYEVVLRMPNHYQSGVDFIQLLMLSTLISGNGYAYMRRNGRNEVSELHPLDPRRTWPNVAPDGSVYYTTGQNVLAGIKDGAVIPARDIVHHRLPMSAGYPLVGVTPIYAAASSSAMGIRILQNSQALFQNMSRPSGQLTTDLPLAEDQAVKVATRFEQQYSDGNIGKTFVAGSGLKWAPITINAVDSQLIEQLRWSVEDVARVFRVPPFLLGDSSKVTYRNSEQLGRAYLAGCLGYHVQALQERLNLAFDFGNRFKVQFDLDALLKTEIDTRYTAYQSGLSAGWLTVNEVRALEGYAPVKGGNENMMQSQNQPLSVLVDNAKNPKPLPAPEPGTPSAPESPPPASPDAQGPPAKSMDYASLFAAVGELMGAAHDGP